MTGRCRGGLAALLLLCLPGGALAGVLTATRADGTEIARLPVPAGTGWCVLWRHSVRGFDVSYPSGLTGVDLLRCPVPGHQFVNMGHFVICDAGEDPAQPGFGIDTVHAAGFNERIGDGCGVSAPL